MLIPDDGTWLQILEISHMPEQPSWYKVSVPLLHCQHEVLPQLQPDQCMAC